MNRPDFDETPVVGTHAAGLVAPIHLALRGCPPLDGQSDVSGSLSCSLFMNNVRRRTPALRGHSVTPVTRGIAISVLNERLR